MKTINYNQVKVYLDKLYEMTRDGHKGKPYTTKTERKITDALLERGVLTKSGFTSAVQYKWMPTIAPTPLFVSKVLDDVRAMKNVAPKVEEVIDDLPEEVVKEPEVIDVSHISDDELFDELRRRGFTGSLSRPVVVSI